MESQTLGKDWEEEKKLLGLPSQLKKENCIHGAKEAMKHMFKVDPFVNENKNKKHKNKLNFD
jgi:hypothetical protein